MMGTRRLGLPILGAAAIAMSACAANNSGQGASMAGSEQCRSTKAQLTKLDAKGVPALVQAQSAGKKLSPAQKADADTYNRLLNDYLGSRCHV